MAKRALKQNPKSVVQSVYVAPAKAAGKMEYYVTIQNSEGETITPYSSTVLERSVSEVSAYAKFFGVEPTPYVAPPWAFNNPDAADGFRGAVFHPGWERIRFFSEVIVQKFSGLILEVDSQVIKFRGESSALEPIFKLAFARSNNSMRFEIKNSHAYFYELRIIHPAVGQDLCGRRQAIQPTTQENIDLFLKVLQEEWVVAFGPIETNGFQS